MKVLTEKTGLELFFFLKKVNRFGFIHTQFIFDDQNNNVKNLQRVNLYIYIYIYIFVLQVQIN